MKRVVITGMGIYSCIGKNINEVKDSLFEGKSGIGIDPMRIEYGYRSPLTGIVERPNLKSFLNRHTRACMSEEAEYAYVATKEALDNAKINEDFLINNEIGIFYGNDSSAKAVIESNNIALEKKDTQLIGMGAIFQSMNSTVTMNLASIFKLRGINITVSAACASGSHAIGMGYTFIKNGLQNIMICGGAQETNYLSMGSFDGLGVFSVKIDDPNKASRPFDASRDGLVPSGGAATLILEDYDHAVKRGATIIAEVIGYGFSSNGTPGISQPDDIGSFIAMKRCLEDAKIKPENIDYINAHATSTPQGDDTEAKAIYKLFGECNTPVSSTKSMTGHECWMAGASEIIYSIIMMQNNFIAPNINFETPNEFSEKINVITKTLNKNIDYFLSNSFGFGGTNSAIIVKKIKKSNI